MCAAIRTPNGQPRHVHIRFANGKFGRKRLNVLLCTLYYMVLVDLGVCNYGYGVATALLYELEFNFSAFFLLVWAVARTLVSLQS
jgi:hypothetical protein